MGEQVEIKVGDVVHLNSNSNLWMTVEFIDAKKANCVWFNVNDLIRGTFNLTSLTKIKLEDYKL